jgi:4-amino-4-deoxy-L-arabinose transferase-like glycosyltransferase
VLVLICLAVYLPGFFSLPPIDRDESRFAQASRQMLESGDWIVPRIQGRERLNKPPMIYWAQAGAASISTLGNAERDRIWMYRLPSMLCAIASVLATWWLGRTMFDARAAWLAAVLLGLCPIVWWEARQARADMLLLACTTLSMALAWRLLHARGGLAIARSPASPPSTLAPGAWGTTLALWACVGAGVLAKGPITPMVLLLAGALLCLLARSVRPLLALRPLSGLVIVLAMVVPWVLLVMREVGTDRYLTLIHDEVVGRSLEPKEGHWGPPLYHAVFSLALFWPGSLLLGAGVYWGVSRGIRTHVGGGGVIARTWARLRTASLFQPRPAFLIAWLGPSWIVFELVSTKLPHYTLPLYPALALLAARGGIALIPQIQRAAATTPLRHALRTWMLGGHVMVALAALTATAAVFAASDGAAWGTLLVGTMVGIAIAVMMWFNIKGQGPLGRGEWPRQLARGLAIFGVCVFVIGIALPRLPAPWVSKRVAAELARVDPEVARPWGLVEFQEDSVLFLTRGHAVRIDNDSVDAWRAAHPDGLLVMPRSRVDAAQRVVAEASGFNYPKGRRVDLVIVEEAR